MKQVTSGAADVGSLQVYAKTPTSEFDKSAATDSTAEPSPRIADNKITFKFSFIEASLFIENKKILRY